MRVTDDEVQKARVKLNHVYEERNEMKENYKQTKTQDEGLSQQIPQLINHKN